MTNTVRILIIEDDLDLVEMLSAYFKVQGYELLTADHGQQGVELALAENPALILLDIRLPDIDGYEVCRQLRSQRQTRHIPVVFLTEKRERTDRLAGLELGAVDYVTKPFDIQELRLRVRNALRRARLNSLVNPITGLPEGVLVQERLEQMLDLAQWGLVVAGVTGLDKFRERYGFVAADDVTRAVSLMITNALTESSDNDHFVGHVDASEFAIVTHPEECDTLAQSCLQRLKPAIPYFYPASDREQIMALPHESRLSVAVNCITSENGIVTDLAGLRARLGQAVG